ncbi:spore germination protein YaaH [Paenibacillus phyllosphaerae]|uniref:Spore germination protein YaaH n=1 Tax=Paenibacillus phyllosphaerae TaxID=274593 RepID=A0A7W5FPA9_9BACL|nr:glycosyl hydrolase family 18 protein [Paenibacillus phyllosphaerae]MBB3112181.1 spore germination protein YaaH [Paenibacillus phyllosphaerae]
MAIVIAIGYWRYIPNDNEITPDYGQEHPIIIAGEPSNLGGIINGESIKLPLSVLQDKLGLKDVIWYEEATGSIVLTNVEKVLRLKTQQLTATMNSKPYELREAAEVKDNEVYIPTAPLEELYGLQIESSAESGIITALTSGTAVQLAEARASTAIRLEPTIRSAIVERLQAQEIVRIWRDSDKKGWSLVQASNGVIGYIKKDDLTLTNIEQVEKAEQQSPFIAWKLIGNKINLTWEGVYQKNPDTSKISTLDGVNVVSPTWFELIDGTGKIRSKADKQYVNWATNRQMQVWALFSNGFEPDRTTQALATADSRFNMIQQLVAFSKVYQLKGINIDFENVKTSDKEELVQFVRELTPILHEQGLVVSIDVTPKSNSELWSLFLDRAALGQIVDYMMVMAYDEHWASSPKAGSVASLPWTEQSLVRILEEDNVPASKIVLGMPLYSRVWNEKIGSDGTVDVSSKALGMESIQEIIDQKKLKPTFDTAAGQNYVEYTEDGNRQRIWIEDDVSIQARIALVRKYGLAGVATWQRTFQSDEIWDIIDTSLHQQP